MTSIDNALKAKLNSYNLIKGSLTQMQRKKMWAWRRFHPTSRLIVPSKWESVNTLFSGCRLEGWLYPGFRIFRNNTGRCTKVSLPLFLSKSTEICQIKKVTRKGLERQIRTAISDGGSPFFTVCFSFSSPMRTNHSEHKAWLPRMMNLRCSAWSFSEGYMMTLSRNAGKTSKFSFDCLPFFSTNWPIHDPHRFIVRDFTYSEDEVAKQQRDFELAATTEKELWVRTTHYNFKI